MKKSNRLLIIIGITVVALFIISAAIFRYRISRHNRNNGGEEQTFTLPKLGVETQSFKITGFKSIETNGGWEIVVRKGKEYSVKIDIAKESKEELEVRKNGSTLYLGFKPGVNAKKAKAKAYITMPVFTGCKGQGALSVSFTDFTGEELNIAFAGGISIKGNNCSYNALKLDINGGADINLKDVPVKDARIHLSGAANIVLSLKGGKLEGDISGAGMLKYYGTVKVKNIRTSGAVKIEQG